MAEDVFEDIVKVVSQLFGVPSEWFTGPQFITNLIIPYILAVAFYYVLLKEKVKILKRGGAANLVVSFVLAFFTIPAFVFSPSAAIFFSTFAVVLFYRGGSITGKRLAVAFALAILTWFLTNWANSLLMNLFEMSGV